MRIEKTQQNFGKIIKTEQATNFIKNLPYEKRVIFDVLELENKSNPIDVFVSVENSKLKASVENKSFTEGWFNGPVKVIKSSVKFAQQIRDRSMPDYRLSEIVIPSQF